MSLPVTLKMNEMPILVVGGGRIATKRVEKLLDARSNNIHVVSPTMTSTLLQFYQKNKITWDQRSFRRSDIEGKTMIIAATNQPKLHTYIKSLISKDVLFNDVIHHALSNIYFSKEIRRGKLSIQVTTNGASPKLTQRIADDIATTYDDSYEDYVAFLYRCRQLLKGKAMSSRQKSDILEEILDEKYKDKGNQQALISELLDK